ncbi:MAG TPA: hypothetical protein PLS49_06965, partial [Candidatus Woesebacteria bacterium]|nr:hypothetical protein [Candidatus Woesebacteria bacterium]
ATVAYALAHFGKPSAVAMHTYLDPKGTGKRLDHVYNIVDINGSCWVIDSTNSDKPYALWDFLQFQEEINNKPEGGIIKYDAVFSNQELPWQNPKWTSSTSTQDKMAPNTIAFVMDKIET